MKRSGKKTLESHRKDISRCVKCGSCSTVCPSFLADRRESRSPRGRMALIAAVLDGRLPVTGIYRDRLATCTGCLACEVRCASGVPVTAIIHAAKEHAVAEQGPGLVASAVGASLRNPVLMRSLAWLAPVALHYSGKTMKGQKHHQMRNAGSGMRNERGNGRKMKRVAFFPGCAVRYFQPDIGEATSAVLEALGCEVVVPDGLQCCGRPFLSLGDAEAAAGLARQNADILASLDAGAIVTACASCGLTFKRDYPTLLALSGGKAPAVLDIHEFLAGKLGVLGLQGASRSLTVHDPCHLGRGQGLSRALRGVLRSVPGVVLREMAEPERCCGFGGVMRATHPAASMAIGAAKARDIIATGAEAVVTGCPGCRMQISDALRRAGSQAQVVHTVQVIAEALRNADCGMRNERQSVASAGFSLRKS